jgi:hypothetical protein
MSCKQIWKFLFSWKVRQSGTTVEAVQKECVALLGLTTGKSLLRMELLKKNLDLTDLIFHIHWFYCTIVESFHSTTQYFQVKLMVWTTQGITPTKWRCDISAFFRFAKKNYSIYLVLFEVHWWQLRHGEITWDTNLYICNYFIHIAFSWSMEPCKKETSWNWWRSPMRKVTRTRATRLLILARSKKVIEPVKFLNESLAKKLIYSQTKLTIAKVRTRCISVEKKKLRLSLEKWWFTKKKPLLRHRTDRIFTGGCFNFFAASSTSGHQNSSRMLF